MRVHHHAGHSGSAALGTILRHSQWEETIEAFKAHRNLAAAMQHSAQGIYYDACCMGPFFPLGANIGCIRVHLASVYTEKSSRVGGEVRQKGLGRMERVVSISIWAIEKERAPLNVSVCGII